MTLGNAVAAHVRLIIWCLPFGGATRLRGVPGLTPIGLKPATASLRAAEGGTSADPAEMARRYGPEMTVPDWRERLVCSRCGSHEVDVAVSGTKRR